MTASDFHFLAASATCGNAALAVDAASADAPPASAAAQAKTRRWV
jgi:hypothetical protein